MSDGTQATEVAPGITTEQAPTAEYVAQMTAAAHGDPSPAPAVPNSTTPRPDHIPEKFWDPVKGEARWDDLAKSYGELEKLKSGKPAEATEEAPPGDPEAAPKPGTNKIEKPAEAKPGEPSAFKTTYDTVASVFAEKGEVTADDVKPLLDLGIPQENIDIYFAGLAALAEKAQADTFKAAGGEEQFKAAFSWGTQNLSEADLAYWNANCDSPATRTQAVEWLMGKFNTARPSEGRLQDGRTAASSGDTYASQAQLTAAMSDPRYKADPAYREQVAQKLLRSQRAGTIDTGASYYAR